jgi:hypothetical protein
MLYNGHKKVHAIKFQSIANPSGMIANLYIVPWKESGMIMQCLPNMISSTSYSSVHSTLKEMSCAYMEILPTLSDHNYRALSKGLYNYRTTTTVEQIYMSQVRIAVEWLFGDIVNYFKFLDFKKNLKAWKSTVVPICMAHQLQNILALTHPLYKSIIISCKYIKQINVQNKFFLKQYTLTIYIVAKIKTVALLL